MPPIEALNPRRASFSEVLRILIMVTAAAAIMAPFFTGRLIGGVDARWYAYMLGDFIEQVRHGQFLVSVGQGSFAWNGSVHLFRSAPVYMAVARIGDLLTFRQLSPLALQHLTVVASAAVGTLGFYAAAVKILPGRRWSSMGMALLYLSTPSWLGTLVYLEAYMSYMAFAALPLVLYGNARTVLRDDGRGYIILGTGLALVWMCHPPLAFNSTIVTVVIQSGLVMTRGIVSWRNLAAGAAAFAVLGAYYFASMSELPPSGQPHTAGSELLQIVGFALFFVGAGRYALFPRSPGWAACAVVGAGIVARVNYPWLCWIAGTAVVWIPCALGVRASGRLDFRRHAYVLLFLSAVSGAAIAEAWVGREGIAQGPLQFLAENTGNAGELLVPLGAEPGRFRNIQPGWGLILAFALGTVSLFGSRPTGAKLFFAASLGIVLCFLRVPLVSNFLVGRFPSAFGGMCGVPLGFRTAPIFASFTAMGGVLWLATLKQPLRGTQLLSGSVIAAAVLWAGYQSATIVRHSYRITAGASQTDQNLRPENAMLDAYAYLLLPIPSYYSHGKMDPTLESRLLGGDGTVQIGPMEGAAIMESQGFRRIRLSTRLEQNSKTWLSLSPPFTVLPQEHLLLRFEFDPALDYRGYLILRAEHSYREYHLPNSGQSRAFGAGEEATPVLSLWNSGSTPEHYTMEVSGEPGNTLSPSGGAFGNLVVSKLDPEKLPIRLKSLIPYRAEVTTEHGGALETFRVWVPGYRAKVDGLDAPVGVSKDHLVSIPVPAGTHEVELSFVGSARLWASAAISGLGWACLLCYCAARPLFFRRGSPS